MSDHELSTSIARATVFLQQVHADVRALLNELVALLDPADWRLAYGNRAVWDLSNKLGTGSWVTADPCLLFIPNSAVELMKARRMIAVRCSLGQPAGTDHGYATFDASLVTFPKLTHVDEAWSDWESPAAYKACVGKASPTSLTAEQFRGWFPLAGSVITIVLPLSELKGAEVLRTRILEPLLALGAKP